MAASLNRPRLQRPYVSLCPGQVKQLRLEREREKAMREQELEMLQREKEAEHFKTWEEQEDNFHLQQAKLRWVCGFTGPQCQGAESDGHRSLSRCSHPGPRSGFGMGGQNPLTSWPSTSARRMTTWPWRCTSPTPS